MKTTKAYAGLYADGGHSVHAFNRTLAGKQSCEGIYGQAVPVRSMRESHFRAVMKIVRLDAASQCRALGGDCGKCGPCLARAILNRKATR